MTLNEFRYAVTIAQEKHFGKAARICFVSQPTLSVAIKKLEQELGIILFERNANEVVVTSQGKRIIAQAKLVLESVEKLKIIATNKRKNALEPLRIGVIYTVSPYLLPYLIPELRQHSPDMPIIVEEGFTNKLSLKLKQGSLDIIIVSNPFSEAGIDSRILYKEPFVVVISVSHPWAGSGAIRSDELEKETVLLLEKGNCFRDQVLEACPQCIKPFVEHDMEKSIEGGSIETIRHMVASGVGVTILPCSAAGTAEYSRRLLAIKRFDDIHPEREVILAWRKGYPRMSAIDSLNKAVKNCPMSCVEMM